MCIVFAQYVYKDKGVDSFGSSNLVPGKGVILKLALPVKSKDVLDSH